MRSAGLKRAVWLAAALLTLLVAGGVYWMVQALQRTALRQADTYLIHAAPLHLNGVLSLSYSGSGHTWRAWASCSGSASSIGLRNPASYRRAAASELEGAARSVLTHFGAADEDSQNGEGLAWALRQWPRDQVWVDERRGVLVATGSDGRVACLLITTVPLHVASSSGRP